MRKVSFLYFVLLMAVPTGVFAQDTLPNISVKNINSRIIISWKNTYGAYISNINIQRSTDSLKGFTTIGAVLNPLNRENGFADVKPPSTKLFYRVFVAFSGGDYLYTRSYRPVVDSVVKKTVKDSVIIDIVKPTGFVASKRVFTGRDNNVVLSLPEATSKKYLVKFFDEADTFLFEITKIKEPWLLVDKVNFIRSGWFLFELYENGQLLEKHRFFIPRDGKGNSQGEQGKRWR
jgi:hypothetical protein